MMHRGYVETVRGQVRCRATRGEVVLRQRATGSAMMADCGAAVFPERRRNTHTPP